jgi:hypothetical protein
MGEGWQGKASDSETEFGCEAHVGISPQKDRSCSKSEMGEGTGGAEGSLKCVARSPLTMVGSFLSFPQLTRVSLIGLIFKKPNNECNGDFATAPTSLLRYAHLFNRCQGLFQDSQHRWYSIARAATYASSESSTMNNIRSWLDKDRFLPTF